MEFLLLSRGCGCCLRRKRKTRFLGLKKKGLIQCIAGKKGLAGACWACWGAGPAGLLACGPCWLPSLLFSFSAVFCQLFLLHQDSHVSLLSFSFLFFSLVSFCFFSALSSFFFLFILCSNIYLYLKT